MRSKDSSTASRFDLRIASHSSGRLAAIRSAVPVPLVLHGASGLPHQQLRAAIDCGVAKVNINTELRQAYLAVVHKILPEVLSTHDSVVLWRAGREAVTNAAVRSIH